MCVPCTSLAEPRLAASNPSAPPADQLRALDGSLDLSPTLAAVRAGLLLLRRGPGSQGPD